MSALSVLVLVLATWFGMGAVFTHVWLTTAMRRDDRRIVQNGIDAADLDAELRNLIEDHRRT